MAETTPKKKFDDAELKERLDALQYQVTQHAGTERAFSGVYWDCHDAGTYRCVVCDEPLFDSETKFESGSGWPSFWQPLSADAVEEHTDRSHGMARTEVVCRSCGAHPRPRVSRRSSTDRIALLHEQRVAAARPQGAHARDADAERAPSRRAAGSS